MTAELDTDQFSLEQRVLAVEKFCKDYGDMLRTLKALKRWFIGIGGGLGVLIAEEIRDHLLN